MYTTIQLTQTSAPALGDPIQSMVNSGSSTSYEAHYLAEDMLSQGLKTVNMFHENDGISKITLECYADDWNRLITGIHVFSESSRRM